MSEVKTIQSGNTIKSLVDKFEDCSHSDGAGGEFWYARDLQKLLGYAKWENFSNAMDKAKISCETSGMSVSDNFVEVFPDVRKNPQGGRPSMDYKLSRYACYLIAQNGDPQKPEIAFAQTYFAIQTRRQELVDQHGVNFDSLSEDQKRLYMRNQVVEQVKKLNDSAYISGVVESKDFAIFHNKGYQGLYGGKGLKEIRLHKKLPEKSNILDFMGSTELAANLFRITQTEEKLRKDQVDNKYKAFNTHYEVGKMVRKTMLEISGIPPEELPVFPDVNKLENKKTKKIATAKPKAITECKEVNVNKDLWKYALLIMAKYEDGVISTKDLIAELPNYITIPEESKDILKGRNDDKFSQIVRNLKSHKDSKTNFIYQGYAKDIIGGFQITEKGREFVMEEFKEYL